MDYIFGAGLTALGLSWIAAFIGWLAMDGKWVNKWSITLGAVALFFMIILPAFLSLLEIRL